MMENVTDKMTEVSANTLRAIDGFLEEYYEEGQTQDAGKQLAESGMKNTQVRGLENLIACTTRFSEIINYIKNQVGKGRSGWKETGPLLLKQLKTMEEKASEMAGEDPALRLEIKLRLARGWARQVVAHYLYETGVKGGSNDAG